jgi:hypothetical protein
VNSKAQFSLRELGFCVSGKEDKSMKRQFILLVTVVIALIVVACATKTPYNPFKIDQNEFYVNTKTIALLPCGVQIKASEQVIAKFESLIENKLREAGFSVLPSKEYKDIWKHNVDQMGAIFDPKTGKRDDSKIKAIREQCYKELAGKLNVDAVLISRIMIVKAPFYRYTAKWDGTDESMDIRHDAIKFLTTSMIRHGSVPALSLAIAIKDIHGTPVYVNWGGIQVITKYSSKGFVQVPKNELFLDEERNVAAVNIALDPLIRKSESPK